MVMMMMMVVVVVMMMVMVMVMLVQFQKPNTALIRSCAIVVLPCCFVSDWVGVTQKEKSQHSTTRGR